VSNTQAPGAIKISHEIVLSKVGKGKAKCPWILGPTDETMPAVCNCALGFSLARSQLLTMKFQCNSKRSSKFIPVLVMMLINRFRTALKNKKIFFCEIFYQRVTTEYHCKDLMGFPMTIYKSHPSKFSVAQRHHGRQMRSGWTLEPNILDGRCDDLNNMLIEIWSVNSMKHALDESYYPQLQQIVKDHKISKSLYDPDRVIEIIQSQGSVIEFRDDTDDGMELGEEELESFVEDEYTYADTPQETFEGEEFSEGKEC
jgi:hypothetical protein